MFRKGFCKMVSVSSSAVVLASSAVNNSVSAEKFNWWLLFLYLFGISTHREYFNNPSKIEGDAALEPRKNKISINSLNSGAEDNSKAKQPLNLSRSNGNSLEDSEGKDIAFFGSIVQEASEKSEETKEAFSSINNKLEELYKKKEKLEVEVEKEKKSGKKYYEYFPVKSDLIEVCEEIGKIKAKIEFFRKCAKCRKTRFVREFCEKTASYSYTRQNNMEQDILDNGVVVFPESEGYTKEFRNTDLLVNATWQLESCRLRLKFAKGEIDERKMMDIKSREDLVSNSVPFSYISAKVIDYFKNNSVQDVRL